MFPADDAYTPLWRGLAAARGAASPLAARRRRCALLRQRHCGRAAPGRGARIATPQGALRLCACTLPAATTCTNALAATACALAAGVPLAPLPQGLAAFEPVKGRSRALALRCQGRAITVVDDTYNANPDSVRAAIEVLAGLPGPRLLVLGDMGEVGDQGPQFHAEAGRACARGIEQLFALGEQARGCMGGRRAAARHFDDMASLQAAVREALSGVGSVLVKGSRFMKMEQVVEALGHGGRMLLILSQWLQGLSPDFGFLRVFQYLTFRAVMAALTALLIGLAAVPRVIRILTALKIGQPIRGYAMQSHLSKSGTPTMGGVLILLSIAISTLLWFDLSNRFVWIVLIVTLGFGAIGWVDDWRKVVNKDPEGMRSREKYFWQSVIGLLAALYLVFSISESSNLKVLELFFTWVSSGFDVDLPPKAGLLVPFFKEVSYPLGVLGFVILTYLVIVGSSNAVNLTDGLDGLAIMPVVMVGSALGVFAYVTGSSVYSKYLFFPHIPGRASC